MSLQSCVLHLIVDVFNAHRLPAQLHNKPCVVADTVLVLQGEVPLHQAVFFSTSGLKAEALLAHGADACAKDLKVGLTCSCCASCCAASKLPTPSGSRCDCLMCCYIVNVMHANAKSAALHANSCLYEH